MAPRGNNESCLLDIPTTTSYCLNLTGTCNLNNSSAVVFLFVSGTYALNKISAFSNIPIQGAKAIKFFSLMHHPFFGYMTDDKLYVHKWDSFANNFLVHQVISVSKGVTFDLLKTHRRIYLVVIEKASAVFSGRFSKMYYYQPWTELFQLNQPVSFDVWNPSAVKTFNVFGTPFLAVVNYQSKGEIRLQLSEISFGTEISRF